MGCSVSVEVWIPGKGFAAVPSGVTFESRFEAVFFFRCGCGPPLIVEIRIPCWKGPMIATTCGYIGRSLIFHQLRHPRLGICCWNSTRFFELASGGIHVRLVVLSSTSLELASIQPMLLNIWWLPQRPAVKVFFFHGKFWRGWHHLHVDNVAFFPDGWLHGCLGLGLTSQQRFRSTSRLPVVWPDLVRQEVRGVGEFSCHGTTQLDAGFKWHSNTPYLSFERRFGSQKILGPLVVLFSGPFIWRCAWGSMSFAAVFVSLRRAHCFTLNSIRKNTITEGKKKPLHRQDLFFPKSSWRKNPGNASGRGSEDVC